MDRLKKEQPEMKTAAIVLAAGKGKRMGGGVRKQFLMLEDKPLLYYSLEAFEKSSVDEIILVTASEDIDYCRDTIVNHYGFRKVSAVISGGKERYHSVYAGLNELKKRCGTEGDIKAGAKSHLKYVLIHDGARPFVTPEIIERAIDDATKYDACVIGMPVKDTIKIADREGFALQTPSRADTWLIQTPQAFSFHLISNAYEKLMSREEYQEGITDDAMVVEAMTDTRVKLTNGSYENIKVTTPEDMEIAAAIYRRRKTE